MTFAAILAGGGFAVLTDWLFLAVLFREARSSYPEVWWPTIRDGDTTAAKIWTVLLVFVASAGVVLLCQAAGAKGVIPCLTIAGLAFLAPAAFLLSAFQFVKTDLWVMVAQGLAWLCRLLIAGLAAGLLT